MFTKETVFILGAGASRHYGYPTGEELVTKIIEKTAIISKYFEHSRSKRNEQYPEYIVEKMNLGLSADDVWKVARKESQKLEAALTQTHPLLIDYFLGLNPTLQPIGTLLIAWVILECEKRGRFGDIGRPKDNWCRFVVHQFAVNCKQSSDLLSNKVSFVTFNYDISLEGTLKQALQHIEMFEDSDVQKFFEPPRALHIYGAIRSIAAPPLPFWPDHRRDPTSLAGDQISDYQMKFKELLDEAYVASQGLRVIDPHDKHANKEIIETAQKQLAQAKCVYILGYGFDDNNNRRLDLRTHLAHEYNANKSVYFTNLGDINRVNKRASKVLYGRDDQIFTGSPLVLRPGGGCVYERSVRNVYEALELDFEGFE